MKFKTILFLLFLGFAIVGIVVIYQKIKSATDTVKNFL